MREYTDFLPNVLINVLGCMEDVALGAIGSAAIRFCEDSLIWQEDNPAADISINVDTYSILPAAIPDSRVVVPIYVSYNGNPVEPVTRAELDRSFPGWRNAEPGTPYCYFVETPGTIRFNVRPNEDITAGLFTRVALKPTQDATAVGDIVYDDWRDAIESGALAMLFGMKDKPWSDPDRSTGEGRNFTFQIQRARAREAMGHTRRTTRFQLRQWI